jgi:hypothetical protein
MQRVLPPWYVTLAIYVLEEPTVSIFRFKRKPSKKLTMQMDKLHGVRPEEIVLFIVIALRSSTQHIVYAFPSGCIQSSGPKILKFFLLIDLKLSHFLKT